MRICPDNAGWCKHCPPPPIKGSPRGCTLYEDKRSRQEAIAQDDTGHKDAGDE